MSDPAAKATDKVIAQIEARIKVEYTQAEREISGKLDKYLAAFKTKDRKWQEWVATGYKDKADYDRWRTGQIAIGKRWEEMRDSIARDLSNTSKIAKSIAQGYMPEVYALNHNYGTFQVEKGSLIDTSYTLYSRETAEKLMRDNPQLLPNPGKKVSEEIAAGRADRWNQQHIQSVMMQSLLQGNSIPDIATRLSNAVCDSDRKAATRNARTMATAAQNMGRLDAYRRANSMGIHTKKQWLATLDNRTRHEHRLLDGQVTDVDKPFEVEGLQIMAPGDPGAEPKMVYNCRCTLLSVIDDEAIDVRDLSLRHSDNLGDMTYDEWLEGHEKSNPILLPEQKAEAARKEYIDEYRGYPAPVASGFDKTLDIDAKNVPLPEYEEIEQQATPVGEVPTERGVRGQVDTGYVGRISDDDLEAYNANAIRQLMADTGYNEEEASKALTAMHDYFGGDYETYTNGAKQEEVRLIEEALARMPVYDGPVYRGMHLDEDDEDIFDTFAGLKAGDEIAMKNLSSWSSRETVADSFAQLESTSDNAVIFRCSDNKSGVGVQHISRMGTHEAEVLLPSTAEWEVKGVERMSKYDYAYDILDRKRKTVETEEEKKQVKELMDRVDKAGDVLKWYDVLIIDVGEK